MLGGGMAKLTNVRSMASHLQRLLSYHDRHANSAAESRGSQSKPYSPQCSDGDPGIDIEIPMYDLTPSVANAFEVQ
jgi:hypothetical protein